MSSYASNDDKATPLSIKVVSVETPGSTVITGNDVYDQHNKPRLRRDLLLSAIQSEYESITSFFKLTTTECDLVDLYGRVHDAAMIQFMLSAWEKWVEFGEDGRYDECCHPEFDASKGGVPPMVPCHSAFRNDPYERPSSNVMGQLGYYCTDTMTPICDSLVSELKGDAHVICKAVSCSMKTPSVVYACTTHPGHHANRDNFGGYCYLNNAALCARLMQRQLETGKTIIVGDKIVNNYWNNSGNDEQPNKETKCRVAIIDVDYHCGNGTASIFYSDPDIFFVSIHCDPNIEYPFNHGHSDQIGAGDGEGTTLHIPLAPGATWAETYKTALEKAMTAIVEFDVSGLVISLGLDTYEGDSVAVNRAGFKLSGNDYHEMGLCMGQFMKGRNVPTVFVQEGGYKMDVVGQAAAGVVGGFSVGAGSSEE
mmetsp:Transcript_4286/g.9575  ORF Transcript_4286/g.9575 Transcript_4286/m.9575 type:complete len:424 (+) Transcript_4286:104-1375(+)